MDKKLIVISIIIAGTIIVAAVFYTSNDGANKFQRTQTTTPTVLEDGAETSVPGLGPLGSDHSHISFELFVDDQQIDLSQLKYMLKDRLVHLENNDGVVIHKHATGVTISYYLSTLGINITQDCLTPDAGEENCNSDLGELRVIVNGDEVVDFMSYEMKQRDLILVNYGSNDEASLQLRFDEVPNLPEELL